MSFRHFLFLAAALLVAPLTSWAQSGAVIGRVTDAQSGEPLPGATLRIEGTSVGSASDVEGYYRITAVPAGPQTLVASYVGYDVEVYEVVVEAGETIEQDVELSYDVIEGEEVIVTAQLEGQARAINQQVNSEQIVNVVSSDRIRELPDANAAESVGRLPGVAIQRNAGEGQKVLIRGLAPRFANITVNGEKVPATDGDRSVDLSMISQDVLESIELYKALLPNQDADAIAGTVNFVLRRAPEGFDGRLEASTGYNTLAGNVGQYKLSGSASNRFFNNKFGVLVTGTAFRADRGADLFDTDYRPSGVADEGGEELVMELVDLSLIDRLETRDRYSATLALDYDIGQGNVRSNSFFGRTDRDILTRTKRYAPELGRVNYFLNDQEIRTFLWTNSLSGDHILGPIEAEWRLHQASTIDRMPFNTGVSFEERAPFTGDLVLDRGPFPLPDAAKNNLEQTFLEGGGNRSMNRAVERDLTAALDLKVPFALGGLIRGYAQFGGKVKDKLRRFRADALTRPFGASFLLVRDNPGAFMLHNGNPTILNFMDESFDPGDFMDGRFEFNNHLDANLARDIYETYADSLAFPSRYPTVNDYDAGETISAAYFMTRFDFGQRIMLLPGFRYEYTQNDYTAKWVPSGLSGPFGAQGALIDTTGGQSYGEFLPMVHMRVHFTRSMDLRLAVTRSLARPLYSNLSPGGQVSYGSNIPHITRGNPNLKHTTAWNYDASLSYYTGAIGLVSVTGFLKRLENIDYRINTIIQDEESKYMGFEATEPRNAEGVTEVYGFEAELQTNLRFLPSPLDGIVLNANYTRTFGETFFPVLNAQEGPPPYYRVTYVESERSGPLPGQADHIANVAFGYEKGGFSGRVSAIYQSHFLRTVGKTANTDGYEDDFVRWDATLTQRVLRGATIFFSANNFTGLTERSLLGLNALFIEDEEDYGRSFTLGARYTID